MLSHDEETVRRLLERGVVTPAQVARARDACAGEACGGLLDALATLGFLDPSELAALGSFALPAAGVTPTPAPGPPSTPAAVPAESARPGARAAVAAVAAGTPAAGAAPAAQPRAGAAVATPGPSAAGAPAAGISPRGDSFTYVLGEGDHGRLTRNLAGPPTRRRLGRYEILEELGQGGMGIVYKARDPALDRIVAIKGLLGGAGLGGPDAARLLREARAAARLRHPNIIAVHEVAEADGHAFLVMDYIPGRTLVEHLARDGAPDLRESARLARDVSLAIAHAHAEGIIHRDLKPENVMVDDAGRVFVGDFGLAKEISGDAPRLTVSGALMGTPSYMSPEQAEGRPATFRSDIWGLGALLYATLTGQAPFEASSLAEILYRVVHGEPPPPSRLEPRVPRDLEAICLKCLEKEPGRRYASAREVADDLERFRKGEAVLARPPSRAYRARRWLARNPLLGGALATAFGAAILSIVLAWFAAARGRSVLESEFYRTVQVRIVEAVERRRAGIPRAGDRILEETQTRARERLTQDPGSAPARFVLGWVMRLRGNVAEAERELSEAAARMPEDAAVRWQRGLVRAALLRAAVDDARRRWRERVREVRPERREPDEAALERLRPDLPALRSRVEEDLAAVAALAEAGRAAELGPGAVDCGRGLLASLRGDLAGAEPFFRAALEADGCRDELWDGILDWSEARFRRDPETHGDLLRAYDDALSANRGRVELWEKRAQERSERAMAHLRVGQSEVAESWWDAAQADLDAAAALDDRRPEAWLTGVMIRVDRAEARRGRGLDSAGLLAQARKEADRAAAATPTARAWITSGLVWVAEANVAAALGDDAREANARAIADFDRAHETDPKDPNALELRGTTWKNLGLAEDAAGLDPRASLIRAVNDLGAALELDSTREATFTARGIAFKRLGEAEEARGADGRPRILEAIRHFDGALHLDPQDASAHMNRGNAYVALGYAHDARGTDPRESWQRGIADFGEALAANPESSNACNGRGTAHLAVAEWEIAHQADPRLSVRHAIDDFTRALERNPRDFETRANRGMAGRYLAEACAARAEDPHPAAEAALADLATVIGEHTNHWRALVNRGMTLEVLGRPAEALADYERTHTIVGARLPMLAGLIERAKKAAGR